MTTQIIIWSLLLLLTNIKLIKYINTFSYNLNIYICHLCNFTIAAFNIIFCTRIIYTCTKHTCPFWISIYSLILLNASIIYKCIFYNWFGYISFFTYWSDFIINIIICLVLIRCNISLLILCYHKRFFISINIWTKWLIKHFLFFITIICPVLFVFIIIIITFILIINILI
jgi:hypothetical protein